MRRRRNSPVMATESERARAPATRAGKAPGVVLLGKLHELVLKGGKKVTGLSGLCLAWMPGSNQLIIVKKRSGAVQRADSLDPKVREIHRRFHANAATKAVPYEWPDRRGALRDLGRLESLTYVIPKGLRSPGKSGYLWFHKFGDHGEHGHDSVEASTQHQYPVSLMPLLQRDAAGSLFIKRMPGNKFKVTEWIYW